MHTLPAPPFKGMGKLIHIAAWAILFGLPFFFTGRESQTVTVLSYVRSMIVPLSFMLVFYANYFVLIDHFLFAKRPWKFLLCNVVLIAASMGAVHLMFELLPHPEWEHPRPEREWQETVGFFMVNAMLYMLVAGLSVAIKMTGSWYEMESSRRELEKSRAEAELQNLKSQLNPHFLFNTLNVILQTAGQEKAYRTQALITALSHLLRYSLMSNDEQVPLAREVRIVDEYYSIYHVRFGDRVKMVWRISDSLDLTETMVPSFILQPIVENAFKHGISPKEEGGVVRIRINPLREKGLLYISVCDNGVGIQPQQLAQLKAALARPGERWEHIGVYNVAARLRLLDKRGRLVIRSHPGRGTAISMYLPLVELLEEELDDDPAVDRG